MLNRGEVLPPGRAKLERYAVPDYANTMPSRWMARLVYLQGSPTFTSLSRRKAMERTRRSHGEARPIRPSR